MDIFAGIYLGVGLFLLVRWFGPYRRSRKAGWVDGVRFVLFTLAAWPLALYWHWRKLLSRPD